MYQNTCISCGRDNQSKVEEERRTEVEWKAVVKSDKAYLRMLILKENPQLKNYPKLIDGIANNFTQHVSKKAGLLVNDDYNYMVSQENEYLK